MAEKQKVWWKELTEPAKPISEGYCDMFLTTYKFQTFYMLLAQSHPEQNKEMTVARIWLTPYTAKELAKELTEDVKNYEKRFGEISIPPHKEEAKSETKTRK